MRLFFWQGYAYVTSKAECNFAARLIADAHAADKSMVNTDLKLTATAVQAHTSSSTGAMLLSQAPLGYCGVEIESSTGTQQAVFYGDDGARKYYFGHKFAPICKLVECNYLQEVEGSGAARPYEEASQQSRLPTLADNARCVPNEAQLNEWNTQEGAGYVLFWVLATIAVLVVVSIGFYFAFFRNNYVIETPAEDMRRVKIKRAVGVTMLGLRTLDFCTDWGFFSLSVKDNSRYAFLMAQQGMSHESFEEASLVFCVFATLLLIPDFYAFGTKYRALELGVPPPCSNAIITSLVVLLEDIPQIALGIVYLDVNSKAGAEMCDEYKEGVDGLAVFSLLMSFFGLTYNLLLVFQPKWFFHMEDKNTGRAIPRMNDPFADVIKRKASSIRRTSSSTKGRPDNVSQRTVNNPLYDATPCQPTDEYMNVQADFS